jgi:hypothetical protein|tara:strand:- start:2475 stop:3284 length:810 start_codon:yes stop_codon:yes gene_type:complete
MSDTIRLFIGTSEKEDFLMEQIYIYSIYKNLPVDRNIEITFLRPSMFPDWDRSTWGTPFTCFRYAVPELCNFKGRALYTDVDMINFRNIGHLFDTNLDDKPFGFVWDALSDNGKLGRSQGKGRGWWCDSVMIYDCEKAKPYMDSIDVMQKWSKNNNTSYKYKFGEKLGMPHKKQSKEFVNVIDPRWNSFDGADPSKSVSDEDRGDFWKKEQFSAEYMWQLHLTGLSYQPWHPRYNCFSKATHWRQDLMEIWWRYADIIRKMENERTIIR